MQKKKISVSLDDDLYEFLSTHSKTLRNETVSGMINKMIHEMSSSVVVKDKKEGK